MKTLKLTKRELQLIHILLCGVNNIYDYENIKEVDKYYPSFKEINGITLKEHNKVVDGLREKMPKGLWSK